MAKRLTTDKPKTNMETAMNLFYIKDKRVYARGGGVSPDYEDIDLFDYIKRIIRAHKAEIETDVPDDQLDEDLFDCLFDGPETIEGLIASFYTTAWAFAMLRDRLKEHEDSEARALSILREVVNKQKDEEENGGDVQ